MKLRFANLSLLTKIMLSTSVAITVLFAITGQIVLRTITRSMSDSLEAEVQGSFHSYVSLWNARTELLNSVSRLMASMSDVRAAFGTRDQATIRDSASELWSRISTSAGLFLVTDPRGKVIASLGGVTAPSLRRDLDLVQSAEARFPQQSSGFFLEAGELYHLSVTPVYVQSGGAATDLLNVLVAGERVDAIVAQRLKSATNSEFLFLVPSGVEECPGVSEADLRAALPELAALRAPLLAHAELPGPIAAA
ncbi:MAG: cache domain-containing protein, partial [Candidatus Solibacter sp.]